MASPLPSKFLSSSSRLIDKLQELKTKRKALILSHNYNRKEVQEAADFVGDSFELALQATRSPAPVILFCGVSFMAETAFILNPEKTVLMPDPKAGCPLADMITASELRETKKEHPGAPVLCYVNTSAEVKAESDVCCTSSNALRIIEKLESDEILFVPDRSMGEWLQTKTRKRILLWPGYCPTHHRILPEEVAALKKRYPGALVLAHPENTAGIVALADYIGGTGGMAKFARESSATQFIVATEEGMLHRMRRESPQKEFFHPSKRGICPNFKLNTLEKMVWALEEMQHRVAVPEEIAVKARKALESMMELSLA